MSIHLYKHNEDAYQERKAAKTVPKPILPKIMILCHQRELLLGAQGLEAGSACQ